MPFKRLAALVAAAVLLTPGVGRADEHAPAWSQVYAGAHIGYGRGQDHATEIDGPREYYPDTGGPLGGGQIGWMRQWDRFVGGLQFEAGHLGQSGDVTKSDFAGHVETSATLGVYGALTAQAGFAVDRHWLVLARGGLAFAQVDAETVQRCPDPGNCSLTPSTAGSESVALGYTIGGGAEYAFTSRWAARLEYQYFNFDKQLALPPDGSPGEGWNHALDLHAIKFSVNYRF